MKSDLISAFENLLSDGRGSLTPDRRSAFLDLALVEFNKLRTLTVVEDISGTDTDVLPLPEKFMTDSKILRIQRFDTNAGQQWAPVLSIDYCVEQTPTGRELYFVYATDAESTYRITYTMPYVVSDTEDTLPVTQRQAVLAYACYLGALALAAEHIQEIDNTFQGATVQRNGSATEYRKLAAQFLSQWRTLMGIQQEKAVASAVAYTTATWTYDQHKSLFH